MISGNEFLPCILWPRMDLRDLLREVDEMCIVAQQTFLYAKCYQHGEEGPPIPGGADMLQSWRNAGAQTGRMFNPCRRASLYIIESMHAFLRIGNN